MYVNTCCNKKVIKIKKKLKNKEKKQSFTVRRNKKTSKNARLYGNQAYQYSFQRCFVRLLEAL